MATATAARSKLTKVPEKPVPKLTVGQLVELLLPLLLLALLISLCVQLLVPFVGLLIWTTILAVCFFPVHNKLKARGMKNKWSATLIGVVLSAFILVPTAIAAASAASSVPALVSSLQSGERQVRPPPERLHDLPLVGDKAYVLWQQASTDMPAFAQKYAPQIAAFTKWIVNQAGGLFVSVLAIVAAIVFASIMLAYAERAKAFTLSILTKITGSRPNGEHYMDVIGATVRSVANGVIGVAFVQALLVGIGLFVVGMPGAGLLSIIAMALGVVQVPVVLVTLPAIIWAFSVKTTTVAIIFTVWSIIAGLSDAVLKPLMIGHGLEVPMPVILLGVIGGVMAYGLVGLFIGAVLLAVGWVLMMEWLGTPAKAKA